jgi:multiple sugar transport system ATP-binding protein
VAVAGIDLTVRDQEFVILVGPSGCGKTTTLRMIAGLEEVTSDDIRIADRTVTHLAPRDRDIAMVFQSYALYPHMDVYRNMAFALRLHGVPKKEIDRRVHEVADILGLTPQLKRKPRQLSGGQRQRVAVGAALCRQAGVLLFDEPLSNLDAKLRVHMRTELKRLHQAVRTTSVYVTHDQVEAMTMGDRIVIMNAGKILQVATPLEAYDKPANRFVAGFIGTPPMNFFSGEWVDSKLRLSGGVELALSRKGNGARSVVVGVRPEHITVKPNATSVPVPSTIEVVEPLGHHVVATARCGAGVFQLEADIHARLKAQDPLDLHFDMARAFLFDKETECAL